MSNNFTFFPHHPRKTKYRTCAGSCISSWIDPARSDWRSSKSLASVAGGCMIGKDQQGRANNVVINFASNAT